MIWVVALAFERDVFGPDATADTSTVLGACFRGWSLSDSLPILWGITGGDLGGGIAYYISLFERDTSSLMRSLRVRQAFCHARKALQEYWHGSEDPYVGWAKVYPKDELSSCGEMVLGYLERRYPEAFTYTCRHDYGDCRERAAMHLRRYLFRDVEEFLTQMPDTSVSSIDFSRNVATVVLFYESVALYAEKKGLESLDSLK